MELVQTSVNLQTTNSLAMKQTSLFSYFQTLLVIMTALVFICAQAPL